MPKWTGTNGNDTLVGNWDYDWLLGLAGDDTLVGNKGDDLLEGGSGNDRLFGDDGNDLLDGGLGADQLYGGSGFDMAVYKYSKVAVTVNLATGTASGGEATGDTFDSVEGVVGSKFADTLIGNALANSFRGGAGADNIDGGDGIDRASYAYSATAVDVDLSRAGPQIGGDAAGDILTNIEDLEGSDHADHLVGNAARNVIAGGKGADYIDGGDARDFVDYRGSSSVNIDLNRATQIGADAEGDQLVNIENVRGTVFDDIIVGTYTGNELIGDGGNDFINGGGGNDILKGMTGDDTITTQSQGYADGGSGVDTLIINFDNRDPFDGVQVYINSNNYLSTRYLSDYDPPAGYNVSAENFEQFHLTGTQWSDGLMGGSGKDILNGAGGDDYITGGIGDTLDGGEGRDSIELRYDATSNLHVTVDLLNGIATGVLGLSNFEDLSVQTGWGNDRIIGGTEFNYANTQAGGDYVEFKGHHNYADLNPGDFDDYDIYRGSDGVDQVWVGKRGDVDGGGGSEDVLGLRFYGPDAVTFDALAETSSTGLTFTGFEQFNLYREDSKAGDNIRLGNSHDFFSGSGGDDFVMGMDGNDILRGGFGSDSLAGGDGSDTLYGDSGHDDLSGGAGADYFYFSQGHDYITDFNAAEGDLIYITPDFQEDTHNTFAKLMSHAEDTAAGLRFFLPDTGSSLLVAGETKATFSEFSIIFLE